MFLVYDIISRHQAFLGYHLLTKSEHWLATHTLVEKISLQQLNAATAEIKTSGKCTDPIILKLKHQVQIVAAESPHSFAQCAQQAMHIKALMLNDEMPTL